MEAVIRCSNLGKEFGQVIALDAVELAIAGPSIVGLLGRNGAGKTSLIRQVMGLHLPSTGTVSTLGTPSGKLGADELSRVGYVPQEIRLLDWMTVAQHLEYVSSFYPVWDAARQQKLLDDLELDAETVVGTLSHGNLQKLAIILAVCHHPKLLVLDEPVSDLDPIVRGQVLAFLLELMREDEATILISSHVLRDVEKVVDWIICLDHGRVIADAALDDIKDSYAEWLIDAGKADLPASFPDPFIIKQKINGSQARLLVRDDGSVLEDFCRRYRVEVNARSLNLEEIFPVLIGGKIS